MKRRLKTRIVQLQDHISTHSTQVMENKKALMVQIKFRSYHVTVKEKIIIYQCDSHSMTKF